MRFISCASYYGTGSSAITDFISEFDNVYSFTSEEFRFLHDIDGVADLEYHLVQNHNRHNSGHALKRYKKLVDFYCGNIFGKKYEEFFLGNWKKCSYEYIEKLTDFTYHGWWLYDMLDKGRFFYFRKRIINKLLKKTIWKFNSERTLNTMRHEITYCSSPGYEKFIDLTKEYIENLFSTVCPKDKIIMVDQIIAPSNIDRYIKYFDDIQVIVVERDPRDLWILEKYYWKDGLIPYEDVMTFCKWYKYTRAHRKQEIYNHKTVRLVQFEDLIYEYNSTIIEIMTWLGFDKTQHTNKKQFFKPSNSILNTKLWTRTNVPLKEIVFIENNLSEYLYDFPEKVDFE